MTTIRVERRQRFTVVDRSVAEDDRLSFKARGIMLWLLSKPDDWRCTASEIASAGKEGRDAVRAALGELEACGYLIRVKVQDKDTGRWSTETIVRESPGHTEDGFPGAGNPDVGFPGAIENTQTEDPPTPQRRLDEVPPYDVREHIRWRLDKRFGIPDGPGQERVRETQVTQLIAMGATPIEVARRSEMLQARWPGCNNPVAMLIMRWDEWRRPTPGEMYG